MKKALFMIMVLVFLFTAFPSVGSAHCGGHPADTTKKMGGSKG